MPCTKTAISAPNEASAGIASIGFGAGATRERKQQRGKSDPEHHARAAEQREKRIAPRKIGERDSREDIVEIGREFQERVGGISLNANAAPT